MATQVQWRGGSTAEHATFTGAAREVTVDTQKKTLVVHDGSTAGGVPLLRENQSNLPTTAPTTGIYNASGSLAISTAGSGRLFVDASGNVQLGSATSTGARLDVTGSSDIFSFGSTSRRLYAWADSGGVSLLTGDSQTGNGFYIDEANSNVRIWAGNSEKVRITSAGLVGVGTSSPGSYTEAPNFVVANTSGNCGATIASSASGYGALYFADGTTGDEKYRGGLTYYHNYAGIVDKLLFTAGAVNGMTLTPTGLGVGTTTVGHTLEVRSSSSDGNFFVGNASGPGLMSGYSGGATASYLQGYNTASSAFTDLNINGSTVRFGTGSGATERARIDSSGRLLVGTSTSRGDNCVLQLRDNNGYALEAFRSSDDAFGAFLRVTKSRGTEGSPTEVLSGDTLGGITFRGYDGAAYVDSAVILAAADADWTTSGDTTDNPSRLVFSTTADGASSPTEACRIDSSQRLLVGTTTGASPASGRVSVKAAMNNTNGLVIQNADTQGAGQYFAIFYNSAGTTAGSISHSGTTSVSFNTSSDYRLKENVTAVTDGITRLQQLKPSRFNFIADPAKTVDGFIAHEVQAVVPEAITGEKDAVDDDGNPIYQGIDQSKLVPLLTAALQEAVAKIESLEARLTAAGI